MDTMKRTTNKDCRPYVKGRILFKANNLHAECVKADLFYTQHDKFYVVYSYGWWPLFVYNFVTGAWYENADRYSVSTSKQRSQAHPQCDTIKVSAQDMDYLLKGSGRTTHSAMMIAIRP